MKFMLRIVTLRTDYIGVSFDASEFTSPFDVVKGLSTCGQRSLKAPKAILESIKKLPKLHQQSHMYT